MSEVAHPDLQHILDRWQLARGLEAGGYYNAAKVLWALAYADEVRLIDIAGIPQGEAALSRGLEAARRHLEAETGRQELIDYLSLAERAVADRRELRREESGDVAVCRACGHLMLADIPERCPGCGSWRLTFHDFRPTYFLEPTSPEEALATLEATPRVLAGWLRGMSEEQMTISPMPGEWSMREGLHHLLVTEVLLSGRVRQFLETSRPRLSGLAAWAERIQEGLTAEAVFQSFRQSREATVQTLRRLTLEQWLRQAHHEEFGTVTLLQQASYFARHDHSHLAQLEAIRAAVLG
jgi:hypothetical protein